MPPSLPPIIRLALANGSFVLAKITWFAPLCLLDVKKLQDFCQALQWVAELSFDSTDFSMDSKIIIDAFGSIIRHFRKLFNTLFTNYKVQFSRKQANRVIHELATQHIYAASLKASTQLFIVVPACINNILSNEMSLILFLKEKNNNMTKKMESSH